MPNLLSKLPLARLLSPYREINTERPTRDSDCSF
jgi:hypothetical protein